MRSTACAEVCALIDREAIGWTEAERLRVEQHLGACEECTENLNLSRFVRDTLQEAAGELSAGTRARAITNALKADVRSARTSHAPRALPWWGAGLTLVAAAAALLIWLVRMPESEVAVNVAPPAAASAPQNLAPAKPAKAAVNEEPTIVESQGRESHVFAHASVQFAPATRTRFDASTHTLSLERGAVDVDVDPSKHAPFIVATQHFRVEVLGTRFSVTPEKVSVEHGRVRVLDLQGAPLASELSAGQSFTFSEPAHEMPSKHVKVIAASALLAEARSALARDDKAQARALIRDAERAHPDRTQRAEAGTLHAELALLEGDSVSALRFYREVGTHYAGLPAAENASFAAAQLAVKSAPDQARALLEDYLTRYPQGRFVDEAKQRLNRLAPR